MIRAHVGRAPKPRHTLHLVLWYRAWINLASCEQRARATPSARCLRFRRTRMTANGLAAVPGGGSPSSDACSWDTAVGGSVNTTCARMLCLGSFFLG